MMHITCDGCGAERPARLAESVHIPACECGCQTVAIVPRTLSGGAYDMADPMDVSAPVDGST